VAASAAATPRRGGTLTVGQPYDVVSFDPFQFLLVNGIVIANVYEPLVRFDTKLKPVAGLAEKWTIAPDYKSVTFNLRRGVKFHSGKDFVADDVVKNFDKAADKDKGLSKTSLVAGIDKVTAADPSTVTITFKSANPAVLDLISAMPIIDPTGFDGLKTKGAGSGPFKTTEWVPGDHITLDRHTAYWDQTVPYVDKMIIKVFSDTDSMIAALQSGSVDMTLGVPSKDAARLKDQFTTFQSDPSSIVWELRVNPRKAPFDKKPARQALQYALNRKGIVDTVFFGLGGGPTVTPWVPSSPAFDASALSKYPFDLDKAKSLFAAAGVTNGSAKIVCFRSDPDQIGIAQILKADLAKIGFTLDLDLVDPAESSRRLNAGDYQLSVQGATFIQKYPTTITGISAYRTGPTNTVWGDQVPKDWVDGVNEANAATDTAKQLAAFTKMRNSLLDESGVVEVAYRPNVASGAKYVKGFFFDPDDLPLFNLTRVEK
jgi:ABC-type transport system substrate-binding protein